MSLTLPVLFNQLAVALPAFLFLRLFLLSQVCTVISIIFFQAMPSFDPQSFASILNSCESLNSSLAPYLAEIQNLNIDATFRIVQELCKVISGNCDPLRRINALLAVVQMLQKPHYPFMLFAEVYLLPLLAKPIQFAMENRDFQLITTYFQKNGYPITTPFIQNMSYNFVALVCQVCQIASIIKPFRVHQAEEYEEASAFKRCFDKMAKERVSLPLSSFGQERSNSELRDFYRESLEKWSQYEDSLIYYFIEMLEEYLSSDRLDQPNHFCEILQYGESSITGETIARLIDILTHHLNFEIRVRALKLFDKLILWGDVEGLLVINFTENVELIIRAFWAVKGEVSLEEGKYIYPEISNQQAKKLQFYKLFLTCLQNWGISFPNHQFLILDPSAANEPSPVYRLYKLLREKRNTIFPNNPNLVKYESEARLAFLQKLLRNKLILKDINISTPQNSETSLMQARTYKISEVQQHYDTHKEVLVSLISKKGSIYTCMERLSDFRQHFQEMVESVQLEDDAIEDCDKLIEHGLELIEIITIIYDPYLQLLHNQINEKEFLQIITHACIKFFSNQDQDDNFVHFYSQKVANRKESLLLLLKTQRSNPLERDLKNITNSQITRQFRHNYKLKLEKLSSSRNSETSQMCLQIFTRTKFTRESREEMDKTQTFLLDKRQSKEAFTPSKDCLKSKDNINGSNSLNSSREKKKLTVISRQRMQTQKSGERVVHNQNEVAAEMPKKGSKNQNSSQTRSSREQAKEPIIDQCLRIINPLVSFQQNSQYFSYIPNEAYKFSYISKKILIFKTPFLTIERFVRPAEKPEQVTIQFILTPHQYIPDFSVFIEDQECIKIDQQRVKTDKCLQPNRQYSIQIEGEMKKIPLRMPTIAFFLQRKIIFEYILPFTINFFLAPAKDKNAALQKYRQIQQQGKPLYFSSPKLVLSRLLFPHNLADLPSYFQGSFLDEACQAQRCIWQVQFGKMHFLFTFQLLQFSHFDIKGYDLARHDNYNESMLRYIINFFSHLLAEREA